QLTIEPGVEVNFGSDVQLTVYGNLVADASARDGEPIVLTSDTNWKGIRFAGTQEDNIINNCDISKANECAISLENDSYVDIIGNVIHDNFNSSKGTIEITGSNNVFISQNIISNNESSTSTAGISCNNSLAEISNNVIVNNTGQFSAFRLQNDSDVQLTNNTIANNESTNSGTPILIFCLGSSPVIQNCIIVDSDTLLFYPPGVFDITYTCIFEGFTGTGNIDEDPLFVNPTAGDGIGYDGLSASWWLQESSPCIDAGNPDPVYNDPNGSRNDMGAYGGPNGLEPTSTENNIVNIISQSSISVYPNPFNPQTNIVLSLSGQDKQHPVSVGIYNIKGQLVKTLIDNKNVSNARFIWDGKDNAGSNASTGVYLIKMETASSVTSGKILMLK
ncbi:MAG: right-handed parallel beta-helix repeat-containing protein, partial [Candidatus Cloacimonetes bacterium]|nr:right-handed parallel beta-helix repeat-containing protein [Candidatus Cloacimonadota bacterium]